MVKILMRTREQIMLDNDTTNNLILEVLLDIRDMLAVEEHEQLIVEDLNEYN